MRTISSTFQGYYKYGTSMLCDSRIKNVQTKLVFIQFTKLLVQEYCKIGSLQVHQMFEASYNFNPNIKLQFKFPKKNGA